MSLGGLASAGEYVIPKAVRRIAAPILLLVLVLYFWVEGPLLFGALWTGSEFGQAFLVYMVMVIAALVVAGMPKPFGNRDLLAPVSAPLLIQLGVYVGVAVALNAVIYLSGLRVTLGPTGPNILQLVMLQVTVSGAEELFFRGALYNAGPIISSAVFAGFHAFVYQLAIFPLVIAFVAGFGFYYIYKATKDRYGLAVNSAAHLAYNCALLGIFLLGYIGGCVLFLGAC